MMRTVADLTMHIPEHAFRATEPRTPPERSVKLSQETADALREWHDVGWTEIYGRPPGPGDLMFPDMPESPAGVEALMWKMAKSAGLKPPPLASTWLRMSGILNRWFDNSNVAETAKSIGHTPPELYGSTEQETFSRRYLPVYGESEADAQRRTAGDWPGFGQFTFGRKGYAWYMNRRQARSDISQLFWFLDSRRDAYDMTLNEAELAFRSFREDGLKECLSGVHELTSAEAEEWAALVEEQIDDLTKTFHAAVSAWCKHLFGEQLPAHTCGLSAIEPPDAEGVYFIRSRAPHDDAVAIKIGWGKSMRDRIKHLKTAHPWPLDLVAFVRGASVKEEKAIQRRFDKLKIEHQASDEAGDEWFRVGIDLMAEIVRLRAGMPPTASADDAQLELKPQ